MSTPVYRSGQSLVEFAVVLPVILLLVLGSVAAVQITMANFSVGQAARAAANQAALVGGPDGNVGAEPVSLSKARGSIADAARNTLDGGLATSGRSSGATLSVACAADPCRRYQPIVVTLTYADRVWVPAGPFKDFTAKASFVRTSEQDRQTTAGVCGLVGAPPCP